jgi:SAM-dependent methyltransferase
MRQKDAFLAGEGDAWFERNADLLANIKLPEGDPLLTEILAIMPQLRSPHKTRILEVGCGPGVRLAWLRDNLDFDCHGIDPSAAAMTLANSLGIDARVGTADELPFENDYFDVVVFGFCLYLCDRDDLFKIAAEADRVLKNPGWLLIRDFYSPNPSARDYRHKAGVYTYKMDYSTLFNWNPNYVVYSHRVSRHESGGFTDDPQEWEATSVLRKGSRL